MGSSHTVEGVVERTYLRRPAQEGLYTEIAARAVRIESRTNLPFSFEKMALRDAVKSHEGAHQFARGLHEFIHGSKSPAVRFNKWCKCWRKPFNQSLNLSSNNIRREFASLLHSIINSNITMKKLILVSLSLVGSLVLTNCETEHRDRDHHNRYYRDGGSTTTTTEETTVTRPVTRTVETQSVRSY